MNRRLRRGGCLAWRQTAFTVEVDVPTCRATARADMPVGSRSRICCLFAAPVGRQTAFRMPRAVVVSFLSSVDATLDVFDSGATSPAMRRSRKASRGSQLFELTLPRCTDFSFQHQEGPQILTGGPNSFVRSDTCRFHRLVPRHR